MILGSKASFSYTPSTDEVKRFIAKQKGDRVRNYNRYEITQQEKEEGLRAMVAAEAQLPLEKRNTIGDASETGIIKFAQAIQDLDATRQLYPVFSYDQDGN